MLDIPRTSHSSLRPHQTPFSVYYIMINTNVPQDIMPYENRAVYANAKAKVTNTIIYNVLKTYIGNDSVFLVGQLYSGQWPFA